MLTADHLEARIKDGALVLRKLDAKARVEAERDEARAKVAGLEAAMPTNDEHRLFVEAIDRAFYDEASKYDAAWAALRRLIEACDRRDLYAEALGGGK